MPGNPFDNIAILSDIYDDDEGIQQLVDSGQLTTASNINRPEPTARVKEINLFNEFNTRNPKADGGMLVKPSADGSRPGYAKQKVLRVAGDKSSRPKPALDRFSDLLVKANASDDIQFLLPKTKSNPSGKATNQDIFNFRTDFALREEKMQYLSKKSGLSIDEIFDLVDDADAYKELEGASISQTLGAKTRLLKDRPRTARQEFYKKAEEWFLQNAKRYDDPEKFKKAFNRTFGKNNILSKDLKKTYAVSVPFSLDFKREFFGTGLGMTQGGKKSKLDKPITDPKKLSNIFYHSKVLDSVFKTTLYNLNPKVRNKITEEFKKIIPSKGSTSMERYEASQALKNNKLLKKFNLDRSIKGPISRLIFKELGEELYNDISSLRNPQMRTTSLLRFLSTKVDKKYQPMFKEAVTAIERAQKSEWPAAKQSLKIASDIMFDHKIPTNLIEKGYADEINYIKASPTPAEFNAKIKNVEFDRPMSKLATKYALEKNPVEKKKLFQEMQDLKNNFSSKYGGYLDTVKIKDVGGKPFFESTEKPISKATDFTKELTRTQNQIVNTISSFSKLPQCRVRSTKADGGRIGFASSIECIQDGLKELQKPTKEFTPQDNANIRKLTELGQTTKGARALGSAARLVAGLGVGSELAFGGFFALTDYASGANKQELVSNLTYGLAGQDMEEQLKSQDPMYGKAQKLADVYGGFLSSLTKEGVEKPRTRGGKLTTATDVEKAMQPFQRISPQVDTGQFFDLDMFERQKQADIDAQQRFLQEKEQRALERGFYDPSYNVFTDEVMAADGGLIGDKSGRPPESGPMSQGLPGILKHAMKIKE